jgi:hypothetical protein
MPSAIAVARLRIGHRHQHPARAVPVRLRQQMPAARINPVVDIARSQLGAEIVGSAHGALDAAISEGWFGRASLQITGHGHYSASRKVPPKYRSPSGETWAGRGVRPRWVVAALKRGKRVEDFLIDKSALKRRRKARHR